MAIRNIDKIIKLSTHPLESHFDIESGSTEIAISKRNTIPEVYAPYDSKDTEIENDYQLIMDTAMDMVDVIKTHIDSGSEARFLARLSEVAGQQLNIALSAAEKKAKLKDSKDKFDFRKATAPGSKNITNNNMTVIMDRNQMLEALMGNPVIDVESTDITIKE